MRMSHFSIFCLLPVLAACAADATEARVAPEMHETDESVVSQNEVTQVPDHHLRIIDLVEAGEAAASNQDAEALFKASDALKTMGASPLSGTEDLAKRWEISALDLTPEGQRETLPYRGRIKGPAYRREVLAPGQQDVIEDVFYAAEPAEMTLKSMGSAALRWQIVQDGTDEPPVCDGEVADRVTSCRFMPLWTSKYRIMISNISDQDTTYLFVTN